MIKNYFQSAIKLTLILLLSVSSFISKSQNTNYFETSKNIEIFTDLYIKLLTDKSSIKVSLIAD